ncbi:hypothetical protein ACIA6C_18970 [Streptomyces sp. NPDC051578]
MKSTGDSLVGTTPPLMPLRRPAAPPRCAAPLRRPAEPPVSSTL